MENVLQDTYLTGQPLKADTFLEMLQNVKTSGPRLDQSLFAGSNANPSQTTSADESSAKKLDFIDYLVPPPIAKIRRIGPVSILRPRQQWEGTVIERQNGSFVARVSDRTNPSNSDELVTFELEEVSPEDKKLVQPGAAFYWTIGVEQSPARSIRNVEILSFRRLPSWSASSVREAEHEANEIAQLLFSE
jgi:hypothetical protein